MFLFSLRNSPEFQKLLGIAMELFLLCSDDAESDVRMVADECLNKVIKVRAPWTAWPRPCARRRRPLRWWQSPRLCARVSRGVCFGGGRPVSRRACLAAEPAGAAFAPCTVCRSLVGVDGGPRRSWGKCRLLFGRSPEKARGPGKAGAGRMQPSSVSLASLPLSPPSAPPQIWVRCDCYSSSCDMTGKKGVPRQGRGARKLKPLK